MTVTVKKEDGLQTVGHWEQVHQPAKSPAHISPPQAAAARSQTRCENKDGELRPLTFYAALTFSVTGRDSQSSGRYKQ